MLKNKHMTITEFVAQRMRDAQQKGEISPDINTSMTSRLLRRSYWSGALLKDPSGRPGA